MTPRGAFDSCKHMYCWDERSGPSIMDMESCERERVTSSGKREFIKCSNWPRQICSAFSLSNT